MNSNFYIPPKERLGFILLILLVIAGHITIRLYDKIFGFTEEERLEIIAEILKDHYEKESDSISIDIVKPVNSPIRAFDPNNVKNETLLSYGLSEYAVSNLDKYRMAGGRFNKPEDLLKIYGIKKSQYESMLKYIEIQDIRLKKSKRNVTTSPSHNAVISELKENLPIRIDPNKADLEDLINVGIPKFAAMNLIKYISKGGQIKRDSDLLKIYGIDSLAFTKVLPSILIDTSVFTIHTDDALKDSVDVAGRNNNEPIDLMDLNAVTEKDLMRLHGIGPVLSRNIVKYRERLGGFYNFGQLEEVYALSQETIEKIKPFLTLTGEVKKIYIPGMTFKEVLGHPYLDYESTKLLKNISILEFEIKLKEYIQADRIDERLIPYLQFSDPDNRKKVNN